MLEFINSNFIVVLSLIFIIILVFFYSYKFQKNFSNLTNPNKIIIFLLSIFILSLLALFSIIAYDILTLNFNNNQIKPINNNNNNNSHTHIQSFLQQNPKNKYIIYTLSFFNLLFYVILPLVLFYYIEEKNYQNETENKNIFKEEDLENLNGNGLIINQIANVSDISYLNIFKNYFYYLIAFTCVNLMYLIYFKVFYFSKSANINRYTTVPDVMRKYSHLFNENEILAFVNFGVLILFGKILFLIYTPYGMAKMSSSIIDNLSGKIEIKKEFNNLNNNMTKNSETIKAITSQKLMTGRPLSKKEKLLLKTCKETKTLLNHKQIILEEKFSNLQLFLHYLTLPAKFIFIFISILFAFIVTITKIFVLYNEYYKSICGKDCGYIPNKLTVGLSLQNMLNYLINNNENKFNYFVSLTLFLVFIYLTSSIMYGLKFFGLVFMKKKDDIRQDKTLTLIYYSIFLILGVVAILEIFNMIPDLSFFYNNHYKCDVFNIDSHDCVLSLFGIFTFKFNINFIIFRYIDLLFSFIFICSLIAFITYLPIKSLLHYWNNDEEKIKS